MNRERVGRQARFSTAQWLVIGIVAVFIGLVSFVFAAIGLAAAAALAVFFALTGMLCGKRRGSSVFYAHLRMGDSLKNAGEQCVDLGKDEYRVRPSGDTPPLPGKEAR